LLRFCRFRIGLIGVQIVEPFRPGLGPGLDARNIRILAFAGSLIAILAFASFEAALLLLLLAFLLRLFARALVSGRARILWHQGFSLPALMAAATSAAAITTPATAETASTTTATTFARSLRTRFVNGY